MTAPVSRQISPRKRTFDDFLNRTMDRNVPTKPFKSRKKSELEKFDLETKKLYYEFCEKQRQEMAVFERDYFLDNIDQIDDDAEFQKVPDLEKRQQLVDESVAIKHKFNVEKAELNKKLRKEETEFWTKRNGERAKLLLRLDENALHGFSLKPRSTSLSSTPSPVRSRAVSPGGGSPNNEKNDSNQNSRLNQPASRSYTSTRYSLPSAFPRYEKPKSPSGFFLPRYSSLSRDNKIGIFPKPNKKALRSTSSTEEIHCLRDIDMIREKVKKTSAIETPKRKNRMYLSNETLTLTNTTTSSEFYQSREEFDTKTPSLTSGVNKILKKK